TRSRIPAINTKGVVIKPPPATEKRKWPHNLLLCTVRQLMDCGIPKPSGSVIRRSIRALDRISRKKNLPKLSLVVKINTHKLNLINKIPDWYTVNQVP